MKVKIKKAAKKVPKKPKLPKNNGATYVDKIVEECTIEYGTYVNEQRHIPDYRDGLKPVQRRVLWTLFEEGYNWSSRFTKCAAIVGLTLSKYHPHGDEACYGALVGMSGTPTKKNKDIFYGPNWSYSAIEGYGNFGSIDGDPNKMYGAAAMRYPECRLSRLSEMLFFLKPCIEFVFNYDNTRKEPLFLPTTFPYLLLNGVSGIAVGVSTDIPPHNLSDVCDILIFCLKKGKIPKVETIMNYLKGPDWTYGGIVWDKNDLIEVYKTGKGVVKWGLKTEVEEKGKRWIVRIVGIPPRFGLKKYLEKLSSNKEVRIIRNLEVSDSLEVEIEVTTKKMMEKIVYHEHTSKNDWNVTIRKSEEDIEFQHVDLRSYLKMWLEYCVSIHKKYFKLEIDRLTTEIIDDKLRIRVYANGEKLVPLIKKEKFKAVQKLIAPCTDDQLNRIVKPITLGSFARTSTDSLRKRIQDKSAKLKILKGHYKNTEAYLIDYFKDLKKYSRPRQTVIID